MAFQIATLCANIVILLSALTGFCIKREKRPSLALWIAYGLIGVGFYVPVLVFQHGNFGNEYSPLRSLLQDTIVASSMFWLLFYDLRQKWKN